MLEKDKDDVPRINTKSTSQLSEADVSEHQLTNVATQTEGCRFDANVIEFSDADPANPLNWSSKYKWTVVVLISLISAVVQLATVICAPLVPQILKDFNSANFSYSTILVSIWELGEVVGPLGYAPLSEVFGRLPVYHVANVLFVTFAVCCATATSTHTLVAFRFLNGMSVASITLNPVIVGDLFVKEQRGAAMSVMGLAPMLGPVLGPIIGGYLGQDAGWRWAFWLTAMLCGVLEILLLFIYKETYKVRILQHKVKYLRVNTGNEKLQSKYETALSQTFKDALVRPLHMLVFSPIILLLTIYVSIVYGYLYLIMTTLTEVFETVYGFSERHVGFVFLGLGIGMTLGIVLCRFTLDFYVQRKSQAGHMTPEQRLPPVAVGALILPIGLLVYGWTAQTHVQWIVPIIATGVLGFGLTATTIPASSYIVDAFGIHAASAMAANIVTRNLFGTVLPLAGPPLYRTLGLGWGSSVLGFVALVFVPVPIIMMRYGDSIRSWDGRKIIE
ncbi:MAG: hypothetical protein M1822_009827 [Bathelium mastoideum]|nr:MAG: hypothetical protein M1822_009827 [Bathelium mastoideum]